MNSGEILKKNKLKRTACRESILEVVLKAKKALSEQEIRERLNVAFDRTTFYRSFKILEEKKILHKIIVDSHLIKYAIDEKHETKHDHVHFYCRTCQSVICLEPLQRQSLQLPEGFMVAKKEILLEGTCKTCNLRS